MSWVKGIPPKIAHERFGMCHGQWMPEMDRCWCDYDRGYTVCSRLLSTEKFGNVEHVTISRLHTTSEVTNASDITDILSTGGSKSIG